MTLLGCRKRHAEWYDTRKVCLQQNKQARHLFVGMAPGCMNRVQSTPRTEHLEADMSACGEALPWVPGES
jgi:hypothetical protein